MFIRSVAEGSAVLLISSENSFGQSADPLVHSRNRRLQHHTQWKNGSSTRRSSPEWDDLNVQPGTSVLGKPTQVRAVPGLLNLPLFTQDSRPGLLSGRPFGTGYQGRLRSPAPLFIGSAAEGRKAGVGKWLNRPLTIFRHLCHPGRYRLGPFYSPPIQRP